MRSVAIVVALSIAFFTTSGWSEVKYYKVPTPPKEPDKGQVTTPEKPAEEKPAQTDVKKGQPRVSTPDKSASPKSKPPKTVSTKKRTSRGPYISSLQIGSFKTLDQARKEESRLKALGIDAFIRHEKARGKGMQYRVYIGKFNSKRQALGYEKELKRKGIIHWSWIKQLRVTPSQAPVASAPATKPGPAAKAAPSQKPDKKTKRKPAPAKRPAKPAPKPVAKTASKKTKPKRPVVSTKAKPRTPPPKKSAKKTAPKDKKETPGRFFVGPRTGLLYALGASDFRITRTSGSSIEHWEFENLKPLVGINMGWRFNDRWSLDAVLERVVMADIKMQYLTLGPRLHFRDSKTVRTYLRTALIHGSMEWEKAPGDFDPSMGAEAGFGVDFIGSDFSFGLEAGYRYIAFDYNAPGTDVTATDSQIDFSGFILTGCARAHF